MEPSSSPLVEELIRHLDPADPATVLIREELRQRCLAASACDDGKRPEEVMEALRHSRLPRPLWLRLASAIVAVILALVALFLAVRDQVEPFGYFRTPDLLSSIIYKVRALPFRSDAVYRSAWDGSWEWKEEVLEEVKRAAAKRPFDPAAYYLYAGLYRQVFDRLPPDFHKTTAKLDPENGIWPLFEATQLVDPVSWTCTYGAPPRPDPGIEAMKKFVEAAEKPKLDFYRPQIAAMVHDSIAPPSRRWLAWGVPDRGQDHWAFRHPGLGAEVFVVLEAETLASHPARLRDLLRWAGPLIARSMAEGNEVRDYSLKSLQETCAKAGLQEEELRFSRMEALAEETKFNEFDLKKVSSDSAPRDLSELQSIIVVTSGALLLISSVLGLRLIPWPLIPSRIAFCLAPVCRKTGRRAAIWWSGGVFMGIVFCLMYQPRDPSWILVLGMLFLLAGAIHLIRRDLGHQAKFCGLKPGRGSNVAGWACIVFSALALILLLVSRSSIIPPQVAGCVALAPILIWFLRFGHGYVHPGHAVRHRLIAAALLPIVLAALAITSVTALALRERERRITADLWSQPLPTMSAKMQGRFRAIAEEWR